ncbi:helix-turn-helix domain-containing protein [Micromonospora sp. CPCC 206060]|uniref:helix-turn-helix domain-containing protein n=1 Tax=Micromonospora sp. CPCC 206060 TaxID=3122406 RepID=UPI003FA5A2C5
MPRAVRTACGLSLRALGQLTHRDKSHLHDLETGAKAPTVHTAGIPSGAQRRWHPCRARRRPRRPPGRGG